MNRLPVIIQGGMGFYISTPYLAKTVSGLGGLGTVSGVAPDRVLALMLQKGDLGGHFRRALAHFPFQDVAQSIIDDFYIEEGNPRGLKPRGAPVFSVRPSKTLINLSVAGNFCFVWLAKEGHDNPVSINYLEKIAMPHIYAITGAMLAGVDYLTMGAGIPLQISEVINAIIEGRPVKYRIPVEGETSCHEMVFEPETFFGRKLPFMKKPRFLPIIASNLLANILIKKLPAESIFGFVIEEWTAGGHNAPPRGQFKLNEKGEPIYGPRDEVDYTKIKELGLPFWIGGSKASPEKLAWALSQGATGIQAGTAFALCEESGMDPFWRSCVRALGFQGSLEVRTDSKASPTGFPFKVGGLPETLFDPEVYESRERKCPHGTLVVLYRKPDGSIGYRCPSEPIKTYLAKGGKLEDTLGRRCICSGLMATAGLNLGNEPPIITLGDDVRRLMPLLLDKADGTYSAADVFKYLSSGH